MLDDSLNRGGDGGEPKEDTVQVRDQPPRQGVHGAVAVMNLMVVGNGDRMRNPGAAVSW